MIDVASGREISALLEVRLDLVGKTVGQIFPSGEARRVAFLRFTHVRVGAVLSTEVAWGAISDAASRRIEAALGRFGSRHDVPLVGFRKGQEPSQRFTNLPRVRCAPVSRRAASLPGSLES